MPATFVVQSAESGQVRKAGLSRHVVGRRSEHVYFDVLADTLPVTFREGDQWDVEADGEDVVRLTRRNVGTNGQRGG